MINQNLTQIKKIKNKKNIKRLFNKQPFYAFKGRFYLTTISFFTTDPVSFLHTKK